MKGEADARTGSGSAEEFVCSLSTGLATVDTFAERRTSYTSFALFSPVRS